jgi:hypothetical protein
MNFNLDEMDIDKIANYANKKGNEMDKELEDFINDDPELRAMMSSEINSNIKSKKKKIIDEEDRKYI